MNISAKVAAALAILDWNSVAAYAAGMGPKDDYPTVIIGSGLGGLCCGAYLAKQGIPVTVIEQRDVAGGYACSFDRHDGRFTFDVSLHGMAANNNAAARILDDLGVLNRLELVELSEIYHLVTPALGISLPQRNPDAYAELVGAFFPSEKEGIRKFIKEVVAVSEEADQLHRNGMPPEIFFPIKYPKLYNLLDKNLAEYMNEYVKIPAVQNILSSLWDFHGLPPSRVSALYYAVSKGDFLKNGSYYIKRRCRDLSNDLVEVIEQSGGRVLYDATVDQILLKDGAVSGVRCHTGEVVLARAVVSNANVLDTFQKLLAPDAVDRKYVDALSSYRPSLSTFIVWLGLNKEIRGQIGAAGIQVLSNLGPEEDYLASIKGEIETVSYRISEYDNIYEGYSKPGTSTLRIFCLSSYEPWKRFETDYRAGRKTAYYRQKDRWTRILVQRAERLIPGLGDMIEIEEAATPLTNWRFTRNVGGAVYGFEQSVENAYLKRIDHRTPLKGLYLSSAWCSPGGGFAGVLIAGQLCFEKMMQDWGAGK